MKIPDGPDITVRLRQWPSITDFFTRVRPGCEVCLGGGLVCEEHPLKPWDSGEGCCGAPGMPCRCTEETP